MRCSRRGLAACLLALALAAGAFRPASAMTLKLAGEYGISYLPLTVIETQHLLEKYGRQQGLDISTRWLKFTGGAAMDEALIAGDLNIAVGGVAPMVLLWARTRDNLRVHAIAALNSMPLYLNTIDANVHAIKDFKSTDRIAMPAAGVSIQAITLMMAAAKEFGPDQARKLNPLTVSMSHPDGMAALLARKAGITAHFTSPPYMFEELTKPGVHRVLDSYDVLGGPATFNVVFASGRFMAKHPKIGPIVIAALKEADQFIIAHPKDAAQIYMHSTRTSLTESELVKMIKNPEVKWTIVPERTMQYARFMAKIGMIKTPPTGWKELFFSTMDGEPGS